MTKRKRSNREKFEPKIKVNESLLKQMIEAAPIPLDMKEKVLSQLPIIAENLDDATRKVYDPNRIWFDSLQFADYVDQLATHLRDSIVEGHPEDCKVEIALGLHTMANIWKAMAENAMSILDDMQVTSQMYDFDEVIIGVRGKDATQS